jgi:hypothetical protein
VTTPTITKVEANEQRLWSPEATSLTEPRPATEISAAIESVVSRAHADRDRDLDLITALQVRARLAEDTGERLSFAEFADQVGFDLAQLRASAS